VRVYGYDDTKTGALNQIKARWNNSAVWFQDDVYARDVVGNVTSITDNGREPTEASNTKECFGYDKWNRLVRAHTTSLTGVCVTDTTTTVTDRGNANTAPYDTTWTFDDINRMKTAVDNKTPSTSTYKYETAPGTTALNHRVTSVVTGATTNSYSYAPGVPSGFGVGAIVGRGPAGALDSLAYDAQQRLTSYTKSGSGTPDERYRYSTSNQRLIRANTAGVTLYLPGMELTDTSGTVTTTLFRSIGGAQVATRSTASGGTGVVQWRCASMQNSAVCQVAAGTNGSSVPKRQRYTPYGDTRNTGDLPATDHRFLNQPKDTTSGLTYLNNRYYDPTIAAFISVDPLVAKTGTPYLYGSGNPTTLSDPSGLDPDTDARIRDRAKSNGYCTYSARASGGNACGANGLYWGSSSDPVASELATRNVSRGAPVPSCGATFDVTPSGGCTGSYSSDAAGPTPPQWIVGGSKVVGAGDLVSVSIPGAICAWNACDVVVVATYLGGDVAGKGSVSLTLFGGETRGRFADVGWLVSPNGLSTTMFFPRHSVATLDDQIDVWRQLDTSNLLVSDAVRTAILSPPDATLTIATEMVGISDAVRAAGVGSGATYIIQVFMNVGGAIDQTGFSAMGPTGG